MMRARLLPLLAGLLWVAGCGNETPGLGVFCADDSQCLNGTVCADGVCRNLSDVGGDVTAADTGQDPTDASEDAVLDTADAPMTDAVEDATADAVEDAMTDAVEDAMTDAAEDATTDAAEDATTDATGDTGSPTVPNTCGGTERLTHAPFTPCGPCDWYQCETDNRVACVPADSPGSTYGCRFVAADLPHFGDDFGSTDDTRDYGVVLTNPSEAAATVTFTTPSPVDTVTLAPGESTTVVLPSTNVTGTTRTDAIVRVSSDVPISIVQYNPLPTSGVVSADATTLLPIVADADSEATYLVLGWPSGPDTGLFPQQDAWLVVANPLSTPVTFTANFTAPVDDGVDAALQGIGTDTPHTFTLTGGEAMHFDADGTGADFTGTRINATAPLAVFSGHDQAVVDTEAAPGACCADHIETQLPPTTGWSHFYTVMPSPGRGEVADIVRVVAAVDGTLISTTPALAGVHGQRLDAGEWLEAEADTAFVVSADERVLVAQYSVSGEATALSTPIGDPAMWLAPTLGDRRSCRFFVPETLENPHIAVVVEFHIGAVDLPSTSFTRIGTSGWEYGTFAVAAGDHELVGNDIGGVVLFGHMDNASYATQVCAHGFVR